MPVIVARCWILNPVRKMGAHGMSIKDVFQHGQKAQRILSYDVIANYISVQICRL